MKYAWSTPGRLGGSWSAQLINHQSALCSLTTPLTISLGELCRVESGQYIDAYVPEGAGGDAWPYIRVDNVRPFVANMSRADLVFVRPDHPAVLPRSLVGAADVVIARTGTLGKAALAVGELVGGVMSQHVTRLSIRKELGEQVSPELLCAFLNSPSGRAQLFAGGAGSTRRELTHERLAAVRVPLITDPVRHELSEGLRTGAESLARSGVLLRSAVALYGAVFLPSNAPGMLSPSHQWVAAGQVKWQWNPRYHSSGPESLRRQLPDGYELVPLGAVADIRRGKGTRRGDYASSGIPFVRTTSLINGGIDPFPDHYAAAQTYTRFGQQTEDGDLVLSIEGKIGAVAYLTELDRCVFKNHIEQIRPRDRILAPDLFLALASEVGQAQMRRLTVFQATLPGLASRSRQVLVPLPRKACDDGDGPPALAQARRWLQEGLRLRRTGLELLRSAVTKAAGLFSSGGS